MTKFKQEIFKYGETVSHYAFSLGSRNSTTNRKVGQWATATNITAIVRSQPSSSEEKNEGANTMENLILLTETSVPKYSVEKWKDKYYDVILVEEVYWNKTLDYYKLTCVRRLEFLGA